MVILSISFGSDFLRADLLRAFNLLMVRVLKRKVKIQVFVSLELFKGPKNLCVGQHLARPTFCTLLLLKVGFGNQDGYERTFPRSLSEMQDLNPSPQSLKFNQSPGDLKEH